LHAPISHEALYEIALTFNSDRDLEVMLRRALAAFIQKLGAQAGAVFRVASVPAHPPELSRVVAIASEPHEEDLETACAHLASEGSLPAEVPGIGGQVCLAAIPGFGALCLIEGDTPLSTSLMVALEPLLSALGQASQTCDYMRQEERRGGAPLVANMHDARARELAGRTRQLDNALQRARDVSRLKEELLASMSHELRTPLNAVLGLSEALQEELYGPLNAQQAESSRSSRPAAGSSSQRSPT
jgi:hypothetical protein